MAAVLSILIVLLISSVVVNATQIGEIRTRNIRIERLERRNATLNNKVIELEAGPTGPVCQCDHAYAFHKNGKCFAMPDFDRARSGMEMWLMRKCACTGYVGPEPLPQYYHPLALEK